MVPNSNSTTVDRTGLRNQSVINVKDLGPQISWRVVFVVEYLGPLLIHPLIYFLLRPHIYRNHAATSSWLSWPSFLSDRTFPAPSDLQTLSLALILVHFAKRELETVFVHRFSLATMPASNIFRNSAHYWLLAGLNVAYWTYSPSAPTAGPILPWITYPGLAVFVLAELGNLSTHLTLRGLRKSGGKERGIPIGFGFGVVTCPNYTFEILAWVGVWMVNRSVSTGVFLAVAGWTMAVWARQKERKYRAEFGDKYKRKRYAMIPGLV